MLLDRTRVAEPADVADVGEHRRRLRGVHEAARQFLAEQVFVADVGRHALAADGERSRVVHAAREVAAKLARNTSEIAVLGIGGSSLGGRWRSTTSVTTTA